MLLIDVINDLEFEGGEQLLAHALPMAEKIRALFTANDAYMRDFQLIVPSDCVASIELEQAKYALSQMKTVLKADVRDSEHITF